MNWHESLAELNVVLAKLNAELALTGRVSAITLAQAEEAAAKVSCELAITKAQEAT